MENLYDFSLKKLKIDSIEHLAEGNLSVVNVIITCIRKELESYYRNGIANPEDLKAKLQNTINEILESNKKMAIDQVYLAFSSAIRELESEEISGEDFELQKRAKEETQKVIQNELKKIMEYKKEEQKEETQLPLTPKLSNTPIVHEHTTEVSQQEMKLAKVSLLGKLYQFAKKIKQKIIPSKKEDTPFVGQKHVWYDENDQEILEPTPEILQEYDKNGLHYIKIREVSPECELIEHHLGKEMSLEQFAKMLPPGVNLRRYEYRTTHHNEQQSKQFNILPTQLTGEDTDMDIFKPLLKRLMEMNSLKESNIRKMAKEFETLAQFMYMINRDIMRGKKVEKLNKIKFEYESNLRSALVNEKRGTLDYVVFQKLLETVCSTYQKAENDEVAKKVSEDMKSLLEFIKEEKESRLNRLATERPLQQPNGIPAECLTEMMTTYIGTDAITMTKEEFLRMLQEREELAKSDCTDVIDTNNNYNNDIFQGTKKYTPFTFPYERAFQLNGKSFVKEGGKIISEDGKVYIKTADETLVLTEDEQR